MGSLILTQEEKAYITQLGHFDASYVDYLDNFRYKPAEHVKIKFDSETEDLEVEVSGVWHETILYEVPLLALISESYFRYVDQDWNYDGQRDHAISKARRLLNAGCIFSEFGTRRRRDFKTHDIILSALVDEYKVYQQDEHAAKGALSGTSNVYMAMKYQLPCIGTVGKEELEQQSNQNHSLCLSFSA